MTTTPRTWDTYAGSIPTDTDEREFHDFGEPWYVEAYGHLHVHPVRLIEDPDGELRGWLAVGDTEPTMIYDRRVFPVCFPYGVDAEVKAGHGEVVRLRAEAR
jgi:hypothetical protein